MKQLDVKQQRMLKKLLLRPDIWRGASRRFARKNCLKTGHRKLDKSLVQQGWPIGGLVEITQNNLGMGEWQLIGPALQDLTQIPGYVVLINTPEQIYAPGLKALGLNLNEILIIDSKNRTDAVAAFVEVLRNSACKALLFWESTKSHTKLKPQEMRRLQLAASGSQAFCLLFRHPDVLRQSSPAVLRLCLQIDAEHMHVQLLKQRGAFQHKQVTLPLPSTWKKLPALSSKEWLQTETKALPSARIIPFRHHLNKA